MNQKNISEIEKEIISDFSMFDSWEDKYEYLIDLGKQLPELEEAYKTNDHKIKGCQSSVWLIASYQDGKVFFKADSDAMIVKGLVSMLIKVLSGQPPKAILEAKLEFIKEIGMFSHLAQTRSNGLLAMIKQMKNYALAFQSIEELENK
ncbi:Fe-S metabolism protein SufE [Pedobacter sp. PACM 27299]|uniref:SufE family protein n=1 Tax=Pedobacter sp. PACM 27299 TaxID=1727164 RepID=UPI0007061397|nr:SufE family protein [Pedobacter sp. PACM 27299]ALL05102.1 Fe-S metabolism protein SufE [Pedobacter sp. PACM 27299]